MGTNNILEPIYSCKFCIAINNSLINCFEAWVAILEESKFTSSAPNWKPVPILQLWLLGFWEEEKAAPSVMDAYYSIDYLHTSFVQRVVSSATIVEF